MTIKTVSTRSMRAEHLSKNLKALLDSRHMTEAELADALGLPPLTIRRIAFGDTVDPRISTLQMIANYFGVTVDVLMGDNSAVGINVAGKEKSQILPILDWATAAKMKSLGDLNADDYLEWQSVSMGDKQKISANAFVLESRPSMQPRYPFGTRLVIEPEASPLDADILLLKIKDTGDLTLKELVIDPPDWLLHSIIPGTAPAKFSTQTFEVMGVVVLTLFYNRRNVG